MALPKEQEDLVLEIAALCDPKDKEALARILTEAQPVRDGFLRQSDYSRNMAKIKAKEAELATSIKEFNDLHALNTKWRDENLPKIDEANARAKTATARVTELEEQVRKAVKNEGGEMTEVQIQALIDEKMKALGGAQNPDAVRKMIDDTIKVVRDEERKAFLAETLPAQTQLMWDLNRIDRLYEKEFGDFLPRQEFSDFYKAGGEADPMKAFEKFVLPKREAAKTAAELAGKTKELEDAKKQLESHATSIPGSGATPGQPMGVVQQSILARKDAPQTLGGGAAAAAAELRTSKGAAV